MKKVEFIDKSEIKDCWTCNGKGKVDEIECKTCQGTGKWKEGNYIIVAEDPKGQKIAFQSDFLGK